MNTVRQPIERAPAIPFPSAAKGESPLLSTRGQCIHIGCPLVLGAGAAAAVVARPLMFAHGAPASGNILG